MTEAPAQRLSYLDVVFYTIVATIGIRWLPIAAVLGPSSLSLWLLALVTFYVPLSVATVELTSRFPGTGSLYGWARDGLGPLSGFVCGWFYWVSLLPYFASLVYFLASLALSAVGADVHDTKLYLAISIMVVLIAMAFQLEGLSFSKWLPNIGALGSWTIFFLLVFAAFLVVMHGSSATDFLHADYMPPVNLDTAILWGPMVFALAGSETLAFLKDEIRGGLRTILKSLAILGISMAAIYMIGTAAMLVMMPKSELTRLDGSSGRLARRLLACRLSAARDDRHRGTGVVAIRRAVGLVSDRHACSVRGGHRQFPAASLHPPEPQDRGAGSCHHPARNPDACYGDPRPVRGGRGGGLRLSSQHGRAHHDHSLYLRLPRLSDAEALA